MKRQWKVIILLYFMCGFTKAQRSNTNVNENVQSVFGSQPPVENEEDIPQVWDTQSITNQQPETEQPTVASESDIDVIGNRGSFLTIVTPEPIDERAPQPTLNLASRECLCVPYNYCHSFNNTIQDDAPIDYATIDVQYNPETSCDNVLDVCCKRSQQSQTPLPPPPPLSVSQPNRPKGCGIRNAGGLDFKLKNDVNFEAGFGEFPWSVAMIRINDGVCLCGGSLIHPQVVLTGSHCAYTFQPNQLKIRAGEWDSQTTKERLPYQERGVTRIVTHPEFSIKTLANDIALLILDSPIQLADHINVICLPRQNEVSVSRECFASGWGKDNFGVQGKWSVILKKIPLPMVPFQQCESELQRTRLTSKFRLHRTFVCAGGQEGIDTCQGDGGAPLVCPIGPPSENRYIQTGCVAWGIGCKQRIPAVYTNVAAFRNWVDGHMNSFGFDTSVYSY